MIYDTHKEYRWKEIVGSIRNHDELRKASDKLRVGNPANYQECSGLVDEFFSRHSDADIVFILYSGLEVAPYFSGFADCLNMLFYRPKTSTCRYVKESFMEGKPRVTKPVLIADVFRMKGNALDETVRHLEIIGYPRENIAVFLPDGSWDHGLWQPQLRQVDWFGNRN